MSAPINEGVNTTETGDETHNLTGHELGGVYSTSSKLSTPVTSENIVRQIKAATGPLNKKLEQLCELMKEIRQASPKCNEETAGLIQARRGPTAKGLTKILCIVQIDDEKSLTV